MVFSSLIFLYAFLPLSMLFYCMCRTQRARNAVLLIASLLFYAWGEPKYVFLLIGMSLCDWLAALLVEKKQGKGEKGKVVLISAVTINLFLIGFFKYSSMFCSIFGDVPELIKNIALPIGISFYTFQLITYVADVYRGDAKAEHNPLRVLLYAALFHQCIAGPIVRYTDIADELYDKRNDFVELPEGIRRFTVGLAKKVILANAMGAIADVLLVPDSTSLLQLSMLGAWLGAIAYTLQIYLDFSAYSDMAIGLGLMIGFHYPENFNYPYISRSITEFWRRWHISLSTFFRDYVYIPLGGNRKGKNRTYLNLFIVWALTGLWHGAAWNFVAWGIYYFLLLCIERIGIKKLLEKLPVLSNIYVMLLVTIGWIFFKFTNFSMPIIVLQRMFGAAEQIEDFVSITLLKNNIIVLAAAMIVCTPGIAFFSGKLAKLSEKRPGMSAVHSIIRYAVVPCVLMLVSTACLVGDTYNPFIYFQF